MKKEIRLRAALKKRDAERKTDTAGKAIMDSADSLKEAGKLLIKALESLPGTNPSLAAAADALINARSFLVHAAQMLTEASEMITSHDKPMPTTVEQLGLSRHTLN